MVGHAGIGQVGERVPDRGQFPVQHGGDLGTRRMDDQFADPEIPVGDRLLFLGRDVREQPADDLFHAALSSIFVAS